MIELKEIEELFKAVNRQAIKALLRNAAILKDPKASAEMRAQAEANVKAIAYNQPLPKSPGAPKQKKVKAAAAEQATQLVQTPPTQKPVAAAPVKPVGEPVKMAAPQNVKLKYSPVYQHYGVTEDNWNSATPDAHQELFAHHNNVMSGNHPDSARIKTAVQAAAKPKLGKSIEQLYNLFTELKKRI